MPAKVMLVIQGGALDGTKYTFSEPGQCVIGRSEDCTVRLPNRGWEFQMVSRHHCQLKVDPPHVRVRDLGSRNGTYVNGRLIGLRDSDESPGSSANANFGTWEVENGDVLSVGPVSFGVKVTRARKDRHQAGEAIPETMKGPENDADCLMHSI